ncbi:hypothetical protein D3C72_1635500 [compost metagenome]
MSKVAQRGLVAHPCKLFPGCGVSKLRLVSQREKGLVAPCLRTRAGDCKHSLLIQITWLAGPRRLGERAVRTDVSAKLGQGDENLAGVCLRPAMTLVAHRAGLMHQQRQVRRQQESAELGGIAHCPAPLFLACAHAVISRLCKKVSNAWVV